eukprot:6346499-Amphidinium_carterae.1
MEESDVISNPLLPLLASGEHQMPTRGGLLSGTILAPKLLCTWLAPHSEGWALGWSKAEFASIVELTSRLSEDVRCTGDGTAATLPKSPARNSRACRSCRGVAYRMP